MKGVFSASAMHAEPSVGSVAHDVAASVSAQPSGLGASSLLEDGATLCALIVCDAPWIDGVLEHLGSVALPLPGRRLRFQSTTYDQALTHIMLDGAVQAVVLTCVDSAGAARSCDSQASQLASRIRQRRAEIDIYIVAATAATAVVLQAADGAVSTAGPSNTGWAEVRVLVTQTLAARASAPFAERAIAYARAAIDQWHTPGHLSGRALQASRWGRTLHDFLGSGVFAADQTVSVPELDSLTYANGVVAQAERLASRAFGAQRTFFCTNGTSSANRIVLEALLRAGDEVLLDRACHQSVHDAMITTGAAPVYLECTYNRRYGLHGPVPKAVIDAMLERHPRAKVLVLTSCTYDGLRYDLAPIIGAAHARGIKVLIDEAWYAHARFHPAFRPTALECGADYVTQSVHKTLGALSQASMIHVNDADFDPHRFEELRRMHASSSPQYVLIASLDIARRQAQMEGYAMLSRALRLAAEVRERVAGLPGLRCVTLDDLLPAPVKNDRILLDPTKITLEVADSARSAARLRRMLREVHHIQIEKHTSNTLSLLVTIGTSADQVERLIRALSSRQDEVSTPEPASSPGLVSFSELACSPREAFHTKGRYVPVYDAQGLANAELIGRVCADQIVFYPPGIPVLVPGQVITSDAVHAVAAAARGEARDSLRGVHAVRDALAIRVVA